MMYCAICGISEKAYDKIHPWSVFNYNRDELASFRICANGDIICGACHKERQLEKLFKLMDARENKAAKDMIDKINDILKI